VNETVVTTKYTDEAPGTSSCPHEQYERWKHRNKLTLYPIQGPVWIESLQYIVINYPSSYNQKGLSEVLRTG